VDESKSTVVEPLGEALATLSAPTYNQCIVDLFSFNGIAAVWDSVSLTCTRYSGLVVELVE
jgi:hypothetical protein